MRTSLLALVLVVSACASEPGPEAGPAAADPSSEATASTSMPGTDACGMLTAEAIQRHVPAASGAEVTASDPNEAIQFDANARSCTWFFADGHRIDLDVRGKPDDNPNDTWASGAVAARVAQGYEATAGIGDEVALRADRSELFWRVGEERTHLLTYGGPAPGLTLSPEALLALAQEVDV